MLADVRTITVSMQCPAHVVYAFVRDGANLPRWASGLGETVRRDGDAWVAEGVLGRVAVRFVEDNAFGVLDHDVTLPSGETVRNPLRVVPNGEGATVTFTLFRAVGVSDERFGDDEAWIGRDLARLRGLLEGEG